MGNTEARELYLYTVGTKPFSEMVENTNERFFSSLKEIVENARDKYIDDYCTKGENPFTKDDVYYAWVQILSDKIKANREQLTLADVMYYNGAIGEYFFNADTMKAWDSSVESELFPNMCFVTREKTADLYRNCHAFTVRQFNLDTLSIDTVSEFQQFGSHSINKAIKFAKEY